MRKEMTAEKNDQQNFGNWQLDERGVADTERRHEMLSLDTS